jgi:short chain dehydrogenase
LQQTEQYGDIERHRQIPPDGLDQRSGGHPGLAHRPGARLPFENEGDRRWRWGCERAVKQRTCLLRPISWNRKELHEMTGTSGDAGAVHARVALVTGGTGGTGINRPAALADLDLADLDALLRVNVRGTFVVDQQAAQRISDGGSIVNVSTSMVRVAPPGLGAYAASKAVPVAAAPHQSRAHARRQPQATADPEAAPSP